MVGGGGGGGRGGVEDDGRGASLGKRWRSIGEEEERPPRESGPGAEPEGRKGAAHTGCTNADKKRKTIQTSAIFLNEWKAAMLLLA